jgi:hypothetical protein
MQGFQISDFRFQIGEDGALRAERTNLPAKPLIFSI